MLGRERIEYKTPDQVRAMRRAGLVVADIHAALRAAAAPGMTTADLDAVAADVLDRAGARSNFLGYQGYPAHVCISVNEEIVHGIPGGRVLRAGDVVSFDCGAVVAGWHGDAAFTLVLDPADPADELLVRTTERAMWAGVAALATGTRLGEVGAAVEDVVDDVAATTGTRLGIVEEYVGHGIGTAMHQPPDVLNYRARDRGPRLRPGMVLCVEPMITAGSPVNDVLADDWTVVTRDGSRAAHYEHTVALGPAGVWVLTAPDGGAAALGELGVRVAPLD
ncbi:type I methionyl aminopeptidase [Georgenia sp. TF02-10]|uniref:type I methionyl aminopeptidase n=1 Tax=Georgenia sp. TF02-10 TaxID=2917725 RepID=UPI001FA7154A|nr:type I methionyl aminopeptidase [Georgenia sp. TF02-10]UNX54347.1 type I methionyl aminopeptidase [Georgenia sp. TF02-10]